MITSWLGTSEVFMHHMPHKLICLKDISISYQQKTCIANFNTTINSGAKIAIIGRNGSGKTSLLNIIHGMTIPMEGTTTIVVINFYRDISKVIFYQDYEVL